MLRPLSAALLVAVASAGVATAADLYEAPPVRSSHIAHQPSATSWTGFYGGVLAGYGSSASRWDDLGNVSVPIAGSGALAGATVGFNADLGSSFVAGIEADIAWTGITGSAVGLFDPVTPWTCGPGPCEYALNWLGTLRGRIGPTLGPLFLYATGGVAAGHLDAHMVGDPIYTSAGSSIGWAAGAGVEYAMHAGWSAKIEYLHIDLGFTRGAGPNDFRASFKADAVRLGLNYRFY